MANRKVTLVRYCKTPDGWKRYPAVIGKNGRVKPGFVTAKGRQHHYVEGHYEVRYYEGSKLRYKNVGDNAAEALAACHRHAKLLIARDSAEAAGAKIVEEKGRRNLVRALREFVEVAKGRGSFVAARDYELAGEEFLQVVGKTFADQITLEDFGKYQSHLRKNGKSDRTIFNRHIRVKAFLRFAGVNKSTFPAKAPRYEKTMPEAYTAEELQAFFASLEDEQYRVTFQLALKCGLREQELMHLQWADIDFKARTLLVRSKPDWGFYVKDIEERPLTLPNDLCALLKDFKERHKGKLFVT